MSIVRRRMDLFCLYVINVSDTVGVWLNQTRGHYLLGCGGSGAEWISPTSSKY